MTAFSGRCKPQSLSDRARAGSRRSRPAPSRDRGDPDQRLALAVPSPRGTPSQSGCSPLIERKYSTSGSTDSGRSSTSAAPSTCTHGPSKSSDSTTHGDPLGRAGRWPSSPAAGRWRPRSGPRRRPRRSPGRAAAPPSAPAGHQHRLVAGPEEVEQALAVDAVGGGGLRHARTLRRGSDTRAPADARSSRRRRPVRRPGLCWDLAMADAHQAPTARRRRAAPRRHADPDRRDRTRRRPTTPASRRGHQRPGAGPRPRRPAAAPPAGCWPPFSWRLLLITGAVVVLGYVLGKLWASILLPVVLGLLFATVLWPLTRLLRRATVPPGAGRRSPCCRALPRRVRRASSPRSRRRWSRQIEELADGRELGSAERAGLAGRPAVQPRRGADRRSTSTTAIDRCRPARGDIASYALTGASADRQRPGEPRPGAGADLLLPQGRPALPAVAGRPDRPAGRPARRRAVAAELARRCRSSSASRPWSGSSTPSSSASGCWILGVPLVLPLAVLTFFARLHPDHRRLRRRRVRRADRPGEQRLHAPRCSCWPSSSSCSRSRATCCSRSCRAAASTCTPASSSSRSPPAAAWPASSAPSSPSRSTALLAVVYRYARDQLDGRHPERSRPDGTRAQVAGDAAGTGWSASGSTRLRTTPTTSTDPDGPHVTGDGDRAP